MYIEDDSVILFQSNLSFTGGVDEIYMYCRYIA